MRKSTIITAFFYFLVSSSVVFGHEQVQTAMLTVWEIVGIGSAMIVLLVILSFIFKHQNAKKVFFIFICIIAISVTLYLSIGTISRNIQSVTGGPVHWHADIEIWNCGSKIDLENPEGISNRIGTPMLHEHNDNRIHVEGTPIDREDIDLVHFFKALGGSLTPEGFSIPTNEGTLVTSGTCDGQPALLQVFVISTNDAFATQKKEYTITQTKLNDINHVLAPYFNVPPGDCIIIEYGPQKATTDHICETYKIALEQGEASWQ